MLRTSFWLFMLAGCSDNAETCRQSVADLCASSSLPCPLTWTAAQDPASWGGCQGRSSNSSPILLGTCGDVTVAQMWGVDASTNYYYDRAGQLVAVTSRIAPRTTETCVAGTEAPDVCDDPAPRNLCP